MGVWHLPNGINLFDSDSTANGNNLTNSGATSTDGIIDGGAGFNGSSQLSVGTGMTVSAPFTIEEWAFPTSSGSAVGLFGSRWPSDASFDAKLDGSGVHGDIGNGTRWLNASTDASFSETLNTWHHVAYVVDASNYAICADGKQIGSGSLGDIAVLSDNSHILNLRSTGCCGEYFSGNLDEARVSNIVRSAGWINKTVPPTAMRWNWKTGSVNNQCVNNSYQSLNSDFQYGVNEGTCPVFPIYITIAGSYLWSH